MNKKISLYRLMSVSLVILAILASCSAAPTPAATATQAPATQAPISTKTPTNTSAPTATPAPTATNTATPAPTATQPPVPTATAAATIASPSSSAAQVIPNINPYCRKGPATGYDAITFLLKGTTYDVTGRDSSSSWWQVQAPGNVTCWVPGADVTSQGAVDQVAVASAQPLPATPATFESSYVCKSALKSLTVALNWSAVDNATGYRIFRDGTQLVEVGPTATSYSDLAAPLKETVVYELEAFNDYGVAAHISLTVPTCE